VDDIDDLRRRIETTRHCAPRGGTTRRPRSRWGCDRWARRADARRMV